MPEGSQQNGAWLLFFILFAKLQENEKKIRDLKAADDRLEAASQAKILEVNDCQSKIAELRVSLNSAEKACLDAYVTAGNAEEVIKHGNRLLESMRNQLNEMDLGDESRGPLRDEIVKLQLRVGQVLSKASRFSDAAVYLEEAYTTVTSNHEYAGSSEFRDVHMAHCESMMEQADEDAWRQAVYLLHDGANPRHAESKNTHEQDWALWCTRQMVKLYLKQKQYVLASHQMELLWLKKDTLSPDLADEVHKAASDFLDELVQASQPLLASRTILSANGVLPKYTLPNCADLMCSWPAEDLHNIWVQQISLSMPTHFELAFAISKKLHRKRRYSEAVGFLSRLSEVAGTNNYTQRIVVLTWLASAELNCSTLESYRDAANHAKAICDSHGFNKIENTVDHREVLLKAAKGISKSAGEDKALDQEAKMHWLAVHEHFRNIQGQRGDTTLLEILIKIGNFILKLGGESLPTNTPRRSFATFSGKITEAEAWKKALA